MNATGVVYTPGVCRGQSQTRQNFAEPAIEVKLWEEAENVLYCTNEEKYSMNWGRRARRHQPRQGEMRGIYQGAG